MKIQTRKQPKNHLLSLVLEDRVLGVEAVAAKNGRASFPLVGDRQAARRDKSRLEKEEATR